MEIGAEVWKSAELTRRYLSGVRAAIPLAAAQIDVMLRLLRSCGIPIGRVLDLGCGDGVLARAIAAEWPRAELTLADFSAPMLEAAKERMAGCNARLLTLDYAMEDWNLEGTFDAVVSGFSIHHQPDEMKRSIYGRIHGVLNPGGVFVHIEHVASASQWVENLHDDLFIDHMQAHDPSRTRGEIAAGYHARPDKSANILAPVELQLQWLRDEGFADVDCFLKIFELAVFGGRRPGTAGR